MNKPGKLFAKPMARRDFLKAACGLAGLALLGTIPWSGKLSKGRSGFSFAIIADSHVDPYVPERTRYLKSIFNSLTSSPGQQPAFVLHLGDVVETSFPEQYEEFMKCVPAEMLDRLHAVPGNHEVRWDESAKRLYRDRFGESTYSFDLEGIHFIALDPTQLLQEPGYFTREQIDWLQRDLTTVGKRTPIVIYFHYPVGDDHYYVSNEDILFQTLEGYNVRAIFTGHVHREDQWKQNGITLFSLPAAKDGPMFFWVEKRTYEDGNAKLLVSHAASDDNGHKALKPLADLPLAGPRPAENEKPQEVRFEPKQPGSSRAKLSVALDPRSSASAVSFQFWPELRYAGTDEGKWTKLSMAGAASSRPIWETEIDTAGKPPGQYRLQIRVKNEANEWWDEFIRISLPLVGGADKRLQWQNDLNSPIQAGLTKLRLTDGSYIVAAATTDGKLNAFEPVAGRLLWEAAAGSSIIGSPEPDEGGHRLFVGTGDGKIIALESKDGKAVWAFQGPGPILGSPCYKGGTAQAVFVSSGRFILCLHPDTGALMWKTEIGGFCAGKPDADERNVYFGAGDGCFYALERAGGKTVWKHPIEQKERPYQTLINSGWATRCKIVPSRQGKPELVLVTTVAGCYALDRSTGKEIWRLKGGFLYSEPLLLPDRQSAVLADESGKLVCIDYDSGKILWQQQLEQRTFNASPTAAGDRVYISGVNGLLTGVQTKDGKIADKYHFSMDYTYSTPVVIDDVLIQGCQDGKLRAIKI